MFTTDLTLSQIKTLRAKERLETRKYNQDYNFFSTIPTLQEYFDVVKAADRVVGVVPETKHPTWFSQQDLPCLQDRNISSILLDVRPLLLCGCLHAGSSFTVAHLLDASNWLDASLGMR